jgi:hypothetical protein
MKVTLGDQPEVMGLFGFSVEEKIADFMQKKLKGTAAAKKLNDFWGGGGKNTTLAKNLLREYLALMASGFKPSNFTASPDASGNGGEYSPETTALAYNLAGKLNVDYAIVLEFLRALYVLARDGKIPFAKWNPSGYAESTKLQKSFLSETVFGTFGQNTMNYAKVGIGIAVVAASAYLLSQLKGLKG